MVNLDKMMGLWGHFFFPYFPNFLWYFKCQNIFRKKKMKDLLTLSQNLFSITNSKPSFTWLPCPQSLSRRCGRLSYTLQPDPDTGPLPKEATYKEFPRLFLTWIWCRLFWVWEMRPGKAHECSFNFPDYAPKFTGFVSVPLSLSLRLKLHSLTWLVLAGPLPPSSVSRALFQCIGSLALL